MSIVIENLTFTYSPHTPYEKKALDNVNLTIEEGEFLGIIGHTGSGKSTFIQHLNGLIKPQEGKIELFDITLTNAKKPKPDLRKLRSKVGMVFQYPEYQLFADTVQKDVAFGPKNIGMSDEEIDARVREAIELVGLDFESIKDRAPFELSGGQKRRVAIAGIIAMRPQVLILDEPSAGLDPFGKEQILSLISTLKEKCSPTVIVISHDIDEIARFANRIVVFNDAKIAFDMPIKELFSHKKELVEMGLDIPQGVKIANDLEQKGVQLQGDIITIQDLMSAVVDKYNAVHRTNILYDKNAKSEFDISQSLAKELD
ncbi:MAG: energy-coupling factor transporter ATPase [Clostridia bacterium]